MGYAWILNNKKSNTTNYRSSKVGTKFKPQN
jgi:hypothetical protein